MFIHNDIEYRNLVEQVQKNKEDIANHYAIDRTLANFGIEIVGQVATADQLPDAETYAGAYGDAYAVGEAGNYIYWIFTRPDPNSGHPTNYWLDVGALNIVGPQGPQGERGPQGTTGRAAKIYSGNSLTITPSASVEGDVFINTGSGDLYQCEKIQSTGGYTWRLKSNIKGPQGIQGPQGQNGAQGPAGPQGPKGETGDVGGFINIAGILSNTNQLPTPASLDNLTVAYLVGTESPYNLYIQVGSTSDTALWQNMGPLNVATYVTVNGLYQNTWNADTKIDKATGATQFIQVYAKDKNGDQVVLNASNTINTPNAVALRNSEGYLSGSVPKYDSHYATKYYVDGKVGLALKKVDPRQDALGNFGLDADFNYAYLRFPSFNINRASDYSQIYTRDLILSTDPSVITKLHVFDPVEAKFIEVTLSVEVGSLVYDELSGYKTIMYVLNVSLTPEDAQVYIPDWQPWPIGYYYN